MCVSVYLCEFFSNNVSDIIHVMSKILSKSILILYVICLLHAHMYVVPKMPVFIQKSIRQSRMIYVYNH